jgi:rod shape-determining protein MreD
MAIERPPDSSAPGIRPRPTLGRRLDALSRAAFPFACTLLLMLVTMAPFGFADQSMLLPAVTLPCVFFWSLFRPAAMPPPVVFLVGLFLDLLGYLPVGAGVLTLLVLHGFTVRWRRVLARQGFAVVWIAFTGCGRSPPCSPSGCCRPARRPSSSCSRSRSTPSPP